MTSDLIPAALRPQPTEAKTRDKEASSSSVSPKRLHNLCNFYEFKRSYIRSECKEMMVQSAMPNNVSSRYISKVAMSWMLFQLTSFGHSSETKPDHQGLEINGHCVNASTTRLEREEFMQAMGIYIHIEELNCLLYSRSCFLMVQTGFLTKQGL